MSVINTKLLKPQPILVIGAVAALTHIIFKPFYTKLGSNNG